MKKIFYLLPLLLLGATSVRPIPENPVLDKYLVGLENDSAMPLIAEQFEVEHKTTNGYEVIIPRNKSSQLLKLAPQAKLLEKDLDSRWSKLEQRELAGFHNFQTVQEHLKQITDKYPSLTSLEEYGKSMEGRPLMALRLLSSKKVDKKKTKLMITSATHGDELITVEVLFGLLEQLLDGYGTDLRLTKMLDEHELYFIPVINPDGYYRRQRYANGVDPNREYPWPEKPNRDPNPCIKAIMNFVDKYAIEGSIDYHSTGGMIMYPWAYTYDSIPQEDKQVFDNMTSSMAKTNGYAYGPISKVIYVAKGSSADYYYWKHNTKSLGIEIKSDGSPSVIPSMIKENTESTWRFIESF